MTIYETVVHRYGMKEQSAYFMRKQEAIELMNEVINTIISERNDLKIVKKNETSANIEFEEIPGNTKLTRLFEERVYAQIFVTSHYVKE